MIGCIAHIAIATRDLARSLAFYRDVLGMNLAGEEDLPAMGLRVAFLEKEGDRVELLLPTREDSPVARFLESRGPGLHHLAFEVENLAEALATLKTRGFRLVDEAPRRGARGHLVAFLHPEAAGGVLVELIQAHAADSPEPI